MTKPLHLKEFERSVRNKFDVYNSLFLNLPFPGISNIGMLIPILQQVCQQGLAAGHEPLDILDNFFRTQAHIKSEKDKIAFMFKVIQYIERQIVLYDSVEDAAFMQMLSFYDDLSFKDYIHLSDSKKEGAGILKKLAGFSTRIVLTAHPTQFYTPQVLDIIAKLRGLINANDINQIDITLQQLGLTSLINLQKPTPLDEAKNVIYFLRRVYYDAVGELYTNIKKNITKQHFENPAIIQLGFWPGGDRDGNPFVTTNITFQVADALRMTLMKCYYNDVRDLAHKLTFRGIEEAVADLRGQLYISMFDPDKPISFEKIITPLLTVRSLLVKNFNSIYLEDLDSLIDKVKIFRTHFATLDIRQNHRVHLQIIEEVLKKENLIKHSLEELEQEKLLSFLLRKRFKISADQFKDEILKDTIHMIQGLNTIQSKNGEEGCNRYIISNSEDIYSVLFVFALFRWCYGKKEFSFDIIPLFESMEAMENAEMIMEALFRIAEYRTHLKKRGNKQTIMLGFSDGTKDGGYLQANWSIFKTKEKLSELSEKYRIKIIFFDGRGGPPARGGGKTHRFYASQSQKITNHAIQLTIQGQTISSKYGTKEHFIHNLEQLLTASLSHHLFKKENIISDEARALIERLAYISYEKYRSLKKHSLFIPYLENKSTLKYYGETNIGSRPDKRSDKKELDLRDLRAIPFVGSWSQLKQNVPGYFGIGTGIQQLVEEGELENLKKLFKDVLFFKALILNSMMSLSKCNFDLTTYLGRDPVYKDFWKILYDEYELSKEMVLLISGYKTLMEEEMITRSSIEIREKIVLPLLTIQQYALQKIEKNGKNKAVYEKIIRRSLYGNINASRNSA